MIDLDNALIEHEDTSLPEGDMSGIKLRDVRWSVKTAGPSPFDNNRTELFLLGCNKAMAGYPCKGCFNSTTWDASKAQWSHDPIKMAKHINLFAPNKYITIGGGEPTDQIDNLIILCRELKKYDFHIMVYTWIELEEIMKKTYISFSLLDYPETIKETNPSSYSEIVPTKIRKLLNYVDIIVDGQYKAEERLWDGTKEDGLISSIGSGNQIIWDIKNRRGFEMKEVNMISLTKNNDLQFLLKNLDANIKSIKIGGK